MKSHALFVDDEPLVLSGLRRMLRSLRHDWDMSFANSGQEALELLADGDFNVIVSDMRMPGMDGATLLNEVAKRHPAMARLVLSGHAELDAILRAVRPAHQFLAKPCDPKLLEQALQRIRDVRLDDHQATICQKLGVHRRLPSPRAKIEELRVALAETPVDLKTVGNIVNTDIAMSVQVLRLVNSAFFGPPTKTCDPHRAVTILGADILKNLLDEVGLFRPVADQVTESERSVVEVNARIDQATPDGPASDDITSRIQTMMSLVGSLAAIEIPEPLDNVDELALSKLLLSYWSLDMAIDTMSADAPQPCAALQGA